MREWENWMIQLNDLNEIPPSTNFRLEILMAFLFSMVFFSFPLDAIACTYTEVEILIGSQVFGIANFWSV